jgi:hypothetical protein
VAGVSIDDARVMIAALARPEVLLVFSVIVTATSTARLDEFGRPVSGTSYITPFGLAKKTSLPRDAVEKAAGCLVRAGLLEVHRDPWRRFDSWRVNEAALAAASS